MMIYGKDRCVVIGCLLGFSARTPAVPDVLGSGRINGPYVRHVVNISGDWCRGWQTTFSGILLFSWCSYLL